MGLRTNYTAPTAENPYKGAIQELIAAGDGAAWDITVPTNPEKGATAETHKARFQDAARAAGYSAKVTETSEEGENTTYVFVLKDRRVRNAKPKDEAPAEAPAESAETPKPKPGK
jgi:hypothetical protein